MKEGWEIKKFENCIGKIPKPQQLKTSDYKSEGRYPIVSQEACTISGYTDLQDCVYLVNKPVVIFGDHTRVLKYIDFSFVVGADGVKILIPNNEFNSKYFYYYLTWCDIPSLGYSRHYKLLKELDIPVPPLPTQERIVSELDCINSIIEKKREQLKELDALAQSIFYDMFGDPIHNEMGWELRKLGEIYNFIDYRGKTPNKIDSGIPLITARNIRKGYIDYSIKEYISEEEFSQRQSRGVAQKGDLLFTTEAPMGFAAIADLEVFSTGQRLITFQAHCENVVNNRYALYQILSEQFQFELSKQATGATVKGIKGSKLECMTIPLPPLPLQQSFASKIEAIEKQKELIKRSIAETETLLASRMQYYFVE